MVNAIFPKKRGAGRRKQGASNRDAEQNFSREPFTAEVVDMASDGRGVIHHPEGRTCFVSVVWLGEKGTFRLTDIKGRTGSAEVVELTQVAPQKVTAPCVYHGHSAKHCGGCAWQSIEYSAQLQAKQTRVEKALANLCKPDAIAPILGAEQTEGYRNRAQFKTDGSKLGYVAPSSNNIVDVETCLVLTPHNAATLANLRQQLPNSEWQPKRKEPWVTLNIDETHSADEVRVNERLPFMQANSSQNKLMKDWLAERLARVDLANPAIELFCGSGNFTEVIAAAGFPAVAAVEVVGDALSALQAKALANVSVHGINLYEEGGLEKALKTQPKAKTLVLDPPRDGLKERAALLKKSCKIRDILYISCDLATFIRDVTDLCGAGYKLVAVQPVDQFPHTPHVEILAHLRVKGG